MTFWQDLKKRFGKRPPPPTLMTEWGPVTEKYRQLAAFNMLNDPKVKQRIVDMVGEEEARRKYPEAWQ